MITLHLRLFLFPRDAGQSVCVSGRCHSTVLPQARGDCFDLRCPHTFTLDNTFAAGNDRVAITMTCEH